MTLKEISKKYFGQIMNTKGLFIILLIGIALLILSSSLGSKKGTEKSGAAQKETLTQETYQKELEGKLAKTLSGIRGAGSVSVMITFEDSGQSVYAVDEKTESKTVDASLSENKTLNKTADGKVVLKNDAGGGQSPVVIRNTMPKVSGVLVVAGGADDANVKNDIVSAVKAVLDVKPHRVQVLAK